MKFDTRRATSIAILSAALGAIAIAYRAGRARADGIPSMNPMYYSGTLVDAGVPVTGSRDIVVNVWDSATATALANLRCQTMAPGTAVSAGQFRVALDDTCTPIVRATPDLWVEVLVNGTSLGRTKIGAVPFAVESGRAASLTPSLQNAMPPVGSISAFGGQTAPSGWLMCDGSAVSRTTYAALFTVLGTTFGSGDGTTTFSLPDLRGRVAVGVGTNAQVNSLGNADTLAVGARRVTHQHGLGDIRITSGGSHTHGPGAYSAFSMWRAGDANNGGTTPGSPYTIGYFTASTTAPASHTHPNGEFAGSVGDLTGPLDGPAWVAVNYIVRAE